ncbi:KilA-N domain-containing protein [Gluconobacter cerinus]|uniref:KilA-N domain-containing protein n=1 Tax=Gluconobacter cerinus TaxID=38307 RepID=UPI001B8B0259|nr:KilA-N domain-containing protein [Gluconobacter cerinus]
MTNNTSLTILSTAIRQDAQGRYCLNDCHKASGGEPGKRPGEWLRNDQAQALVAELTDAENSASPVSSVKGGSNQGTYGSEELVLAYAQWISPAFHVQCLRALLSLMKGEIPSVRAKRPRKPAFDVAYRRLLSVASTLPNVDENQRCLMAARGTHELTGINPLELLGATSIAAPKAENYLTPTQIGEEIGMSARAVNVTLIQQGYQVKVTSSAVGSDYEPTEKGKDVSRFFDTTRRHGKGSQQQLKWSPRMVAILRPFAKKPEPAS